MKTLLIAVLSYLLARLAGPRPATPLEYPAPGGPITAEWARSVVDAIRELRGDGPSDPAPIARLADLPGVEKYVDPRYGPFRVEATAAGRTGPIFETFEGFRAWIDAKRPPLAGIGSYRAYPDYDSPPALPFKPAFEKLPA